ncbi:hypothetical protein ACQZ6A_12055 [Agrobacterium vitis]
MLRKYRTVIFVHGCFWHGHDCRKGKLPATNLAMLQAKILKNVERCCSWNRSDGLLRFFGNAALSRSRPS